MRFRSWLVEDFDPTPASAEVKRTNLQPQVDAQEIDTPAKRDDDKTLAIDASIQRLDMEIPDGDSKDPKINKFKELWNHLKEKWQELKTMPPEEGDAEALGNNMGDKKYLAQMMQHKNMVPASPEMPSGPGTFGVS